MILYIIQNICVIHKYLSNIDQNKIVFYIILINMNFYDAIIYIDIEILMQFVK